MAFQFPENDLDHPESLAELIGSFWTEIYDGGQLTTDYVRGRSATERQNHANLAEWVQTLDNHTVPIYNQRRWHRITLNNSTKSFAQYFLYDGTIVYGNQPVSGVLHYYGEPADRSVAYDDTTGLKGCTQITNGITNPTVVLTNGVECYLDASTGRIVFVDDPFLNPLLATEVDDDGNLTLDLWVFQARLDKNYIEDHAGYVIDVPGESSLRYRQLVSSVFDAYTGATAAEQVNDIITGMTGIPHVTNDGEKVEVIQDDNANKLIITDRNVYKFALGSTPTVSVGDTVNQGQWMIDAVTVIEPHRGLVPSSSVIPALSLGKGFLLDSIQSELIFANRDVSITSSVVSDKLKVEWELGGFEVDKTQFFTDMHTRGIARGKTMAEYLDVRDNPTTEPDATNMPATINPLEFLFQNVLRHNTYIIKLVARYFGDDAIGLDNAWVLRRIIPPQTSLILYIELEALEEDVKMDGAGSSVETGYDDSEFEIFVP